PALCRNLLSHGQYPDSPTRSLPYSSRHHRDILAVEGDHADQAAQSLQGRQVEKLDRGGIRSQCLEDLFDGVLAGHEPADRLRLGAFAPAGPGSSGVTLPPTLLAHSSPLLPRLRRGINV